MLYLQNITNKTEHFSYKSEYVRRIGDEAFKRNCDCNFNYRDKG